MSADHSDADCMGTYVREALSHKLLTAERELELGRAIRAGGPDAPEARERLIASNLRLVVYVARRYEHMGLFALEDLIQEGSIGLMRAVDRYDPGQGYRFATYAVWWIRQAIQQALYHDARTIRLPRDALLQLVHARDLRDRIKERTGISPTCDELADAIGITPARLRHLKRFWSRPLSLDYAVGEDRDTPMGEIVADADAPAPENMDLDAPALRQLLDESMMSLTAREERIVRLFYGLDGQDAMSESEIAARFHLSRQRIDQILIKVRGRLRALPKLAAWVY